MVHNCREMLFKEYWSLCVVCAVRACMSYLCIIFLKIVMSVMYVKINVSIVRQEIEINSD